MYFFIYKALILQKISKNFVKSSPCTAGREVTGETCYNKLARRRVKYYTIEVPI